MCQALVPEGVTAVVVRFACHREAVFVGRACSAASWCCPALAGFLHACVLVCAVCGCVRRHRNADVRAVTDCELWTLDRNTFRQVIATTAVRVVQHKVSFLQR